MTGRGELPPDEAAYDGAVHEERIAREFGATDTTALHYELQRDGRWHADPALPRYRPALP